MRKTYRTRISVYVATDCTQRFPKKKEKEKKKGCVCGIIEKKSHQYTVRTALIFQRKPAAPELCYQPA